MDSLITLFILTPCDGSNQLNYFEQYIMSEVNFIPLTYLVSLSKKTELLLSHSASLTGDKQKGEEKVSESDPMVLSRLTSSDSSQEPSSPSSPAEGSCCWGEAVSAPVSTTRPWFSADVLVLMFLSSSSSSSWATGGREWGLEGKVGLKLIQIEE